MACQIVFDDCQRVPGLKVLYLRSVGKSARESFEDLLKKAMPTMMQYYVRSRSAVELFNGSRVILGGFRNERDIDSYLGIEYDLVAIDDAHSLSKSKTDQVLGSLRTSKDNWRPRNYITFNPGGIGHGHLKRRFVEPWRKKQETDTRFFFSLPEDNVFLNPEYLQYLEGLTGWLYKAWRKGDFDISAGQYFTTWDYDTHVIEPFGLPRNWRYWLAMDYGFTHYTVFHLLGQSNDGIVYAIDEHAERRWLVKRHAPAVKAMVHRNGLEWYMIEKCVAGADVFAQRGTTTATIADQYADNNIVLERAQMDRISGAANILDYLGDPNGQPVIEPHLFIFNRCSRLIETLPLMEHDPHRPEDVLKVDVDDDGNGGDDFYDGFRYALMEAPHRGGAWTVKYA